MKDTYAECRLEVTRGFFGTEAPRLQYETAQAIKFVLQEGAPWRRIAEYMGVSVATAYGWFRRHRYDPHPDPEREALREVAERIEQRASRTRQGVLGYPVAKADRKAGCDGGR